MLSVAVLSEEAFNEKPKKHSEEKSNIGLILIHGAGCDHRAWPKLNLDEELKGLANKYQIIAPELPAHGASAKTDDITLADYASSIWNWIQNQNFNQVFICGHSMGGAITQLLAQEYPDKISGIILLNTGAKLGTSPELIQQLSNPASRQNTIDAMTALSIADSADQAVYNRIRDMFSQISTETLIQDLMNCDSFNNLSQVHTIKLPTLIIAGENDQLTFPHYSTYLADQIKDSTLTQFSDCGHFAMLEHPRLFWRTVLTWIKNLG